MARMKRLQFGLSSLVFAAFLLGILILFNLAAYPTIFPGLFYPQYISCLPEFGWPIPFYPSYNISSNKGETYLDVDDSANLGVLFFDLLVNLALFGTACWLFERWVRLRAKGVLSSSNTK